MELVKLLAIFRESCVFNFGGTMFGIQLQLLCQGIWGLELWEKSQQKRKAKRLLSAIMVSCLIYMSDFALPAVKKCGTRQEILSSFACQITFLCRNIKIVENICQHWEWFWFISEVDLVFICQKLFFSDSFADSLFLNPLAGHRQVMCELSNTLKQLRQSQDAVL